MCCVPLFIVIFILRVQSVFVCTTPVIAALNTCKVLKHTCFPLHRKQYTFLQNMTRNDVISTGDRVSTVTERKTAFTIRNTKTTKSSSFFFIGFMFNIIQKNTIQILLKHDFLLDGSNISYKAKRLRTGHTASVQYFT
jgi:hypothetical protein